ncbi:nickel-dependent hydrogenase large subunit [Halodesulfovibrio sp.]|jgi:hydrogenase large subunit|uniref:nickel-dependent hydrogenase large subunit n=1 Tax=Halodesulfovibrio sp. TaxID=1912772 RepID=UPI0025F7E265|nr:nickel-dependent hydrogenase large subunit [Halodesulfovibrio sp.]MCT4625451.1 nickel-dependent hydrogenase large subunit [Halodesulfovibrio sp.]
MKKIIHPLTRVEGHMKMEIETASDASGNQTITNAACAGSLYRGFENILIGRNPVDAITITERICGVCPVVHGITAATALENASGEQPPKNAKIVRDLMLASNFVANHITHFYLLALPDYVAGSQGSFAQETWSVDMRSDAALQSIPTHMNKALEARRKAHEMTAIFGGRMPHPPSIIPGGQTAGLETARVNKFKALLAEVKAFTRTYFRPDVETLARVYPEYYNIGRGPGNLMCFDVFSHGTNSPLLPGGYVLDGSSTVNKVYTGEIEETTKFAFYTEESGGHPSSGSTTPEYPKDDAYTWTKAPRYRGLPMECGPLARLWMSGKYRHGISAMDRMMARLVETELLLTEMSSWITQGDASSVHNGFNVPNSAKAFGLTEAPRGAIGHWLSISEGKISSYQVITPTCWNCSPKDASGKHGALEEALLSVPVTNIDQPIEALRVVHSFDPCLDCSVHVMQADAKEHHIVG